MKPKTDAERLSQKERTLIESKKKAKIVASQLRYPDEIKHMIDTAKNEDEVINALATGRKQKEW